MPAPSNRWEQFLQAKGLPFNTTPTVELQKEYQANPSGVHWAPVSNYTQDDGSGAMPQTYVTYQNLETGETTTEKPTTGTILKELGYADIDGGRMVYQDPNTGAFYKDGQKWNAAPAEVSRALTNTAESQAEFNKQHSNQEDFLGQYAPAIILGGAGILAGGGGAALAASEGAAGTAAASTTAAMPSFGDLLGTAVSNIPKNFAINAAGQLITTGTIDPEKALIGSVVGAAGGIAGQYAGAAAGGGLIGSVVGGGVSGGLQSALLGNKDMLASIVASGIASGAGSLTQDWLNANAQALSDATGVGVADIKNTIQGAVRAGITAVAQGKDAKTALTETLLGAGLGYVSGDIEKAWKSATGKTDTPATEGPEPDPYAEVSLGADYQATFTVEEANAPAEGLRDTGEYQLSFGDLLSIEQSEIGPVQDANEAADGLRDTSPGLIESAITDINAPEEGLRDSSTGLPGQVYRPGQGWGEWTLDGDWVPAETADTYENNSPPSDEYIEPETGGYSDVTQEPETGGYSDIITEPETGGYSDIETEPETGGYSDIETEPETGGYSDTPESQVVAQPLTPPTTVNPVVIAPVIVPEPPGNKQGPVVRPPPATEPSKPNLSLSFADISLSYNPVQRGYIDWAKPRT